MTGLLPIAFVFAVGAYIQPVQGDLTRLGRLAERDFGWNASQPVITTRTNRVPAPRVIVIGDSFSRMNFWQSVSMDHGSPEMLTFHWDDRSSPPNCVRQLVLSLKATYPSVQVLILQTVERNFVLRFGAEQSACAIPKLEPVEVFPISTPVSRDTGFTFDMPDTLYALRALRNSFRRFDVRQELGDSLVVPLARPDLFSNRRSDRLVYLKDDEIKTSWTRTAVAGTVGRLRSLQQEAARQGLTLVVAAVPDKSTVYRKFIARGLSPPPPDIWQEMNTQGVESVDLESALVGALGSNRDIYLPNDTHLGPAGFLLVGTAIADRLGSILRQGANSRAAESLGDSSTVLRKLRLAPRGDWQSTRSEPASR
jgi:hypothetical protein